MEKISKKGERKKPPQTKKIEVKAKEVKGREIIVRHQVHLQKWDGFESRLVIWKKIYKEG